ncbi:MAG: SCO family protein [Silicimonas sp.]|nr:SCO family protein [Silicimonas sp.]MBT8424499.1 SCO family protein [Silicimonas sp.]NND22151.1 SCO family protein [Silicimonas sp.]NND41932.1 SCO family protein [Silicimonas sp.]
MSRLYVGVAALALSAIIGGTALYTMLATPRSCGGNAVAGGSAAIGGPFELVQPDGQLVTDADIIDRPALVYFGYTFCPDVCPFDVARNALAIDILQEQGIDVRPVFITIDPARDTPDVMAQYAADMHPKMVALTGSEEQIKAAAQAYKAYYAKGSGEGDFYLMDHSTFTYLMLPDTGLATYFGRTATPEEIAEQTTCLIDAA